MAPWSVSSRLAYGFAAFNGGSCGTCYQIEFTGSSSSGSSDALSTLPNSVVDTMMKSNRNVKKCFYQEYKRSDGNLGTATLKIKILPSGKVSSAYVTTDRYKGTELDSCLSAAAYTVQIRTSTF